VRHPILVSGYRPVGMEVICASETSVPTQYSVSHSRR